jgi:hypothetical protein
MARRKWAVVITAIDAKFDLHELTWLFLTTLPVSHLMCDLDRTAIYRSQIT